MFMRRLQDFPTADAEWEIKGIGYQTKRRKALFLDTAHHALTAPVQRSFFRKVARHRPVSREDAVQVEYPPDLHRQ